MQKIKNDSGFNDDILAGGDSGPSRKFEKWFDKEMAQTQQVEALSQLEKQHQTIATMAYFKGLDAD